MTSFYHDYIYKDPTLKSTVIGTNGQGLNTWWGGDTTHPFTGRDQWYCQAFERMPPANPCTAPAENSPAPKVNTAKVEKPWFQNRYIFNPDFSTQYLKIFIWPCGSEFLFYRFKCSYFKEWTFLTTFMAGAYFENLHQVLYVVLKCKPRNHLQSLASSRLLATSQKYSRLQDQSDKTFKFLCRISET